jgi:hypothetical protein
MRALLPKPRVSLAITHFLPPLYKSKTVLVSHRAEPYHFPHLAPPQVARVLECAAFASILYLVTTKMANAHSPHAFAKSVNQSSSKMAVNNSSRRLHTQITIRPIRLQDLRRLTQRSLLAWRMATAHSVQAPE